MSNDRSTTRNELLTGALQGLLTQPQIAKLRLIAQANDLVRTDIVVYADEVKE